MNLLTQLENQLARFYTNFPNLPQAGRRWLATNAWWLILIIAILNTIGCLSLVSGLIGLAVASHQTNIYSVGYGTFSFVTTIIGLVASVVGTVLYFSAVRSLKEMRRRGWRLIFLAQVVGVAFSLLNIILSAISLGSPATIAGLFVGFVIGIAFTLLWLYFVFQIRGEFGSRVANAVEAEVVAKVTRKK